MMNSLSTVLALSLPLSEFELHGNALSSASFHASQANTGLDRTSGQAATNSIGEITQQMESLELSGRIHSIKVPSFRVTQLDSIVDLADELANVVSAIRVVADRVSDIAFSVTSKDKQNELRASNTETLRGILKNFSWDSDYKVSLHNAKDKIGTETRNIDTDINEKFSEYMSVDSEIAKLKSGNDSSLAVRPISCILNKDHKLFEKLENSEYLLPQIIVVPTQKEEEFVKFLTELKSSKVPDKKCAVVVPDSHSIMAKDVDSTMYCVVIMARDVDQFQAAVKKKQWIVREYKGEKPMSGAEAESQVKELESNKAQLRQSCVALARASFSDIVGLWMHAIGLWLYTESILRYGMREECVYLLVELGSRPEKEARDVLQRRFGHLDARLGELDRKQKSNKGPSLEEVALPGIRVDNDYLPFVFKKMEIPGTKR